jgi:hypothetical protein
MNVSQSFIGDFHACMNFLEEIKNKYDYKYYSIVRVSKEPEMYKIEITYVAPKLGEE